MHLLYRNDPTGEDYAIVFTLAIFSAGGVITAYPGAGWSYIQQLIIFLIAADLFGGIATHASRSKQAWNKVRPAWFDTAYLLAHIIHPLLIVVVADPGNWTYAITLYIYAMATAFTVKSLERSSHLRTTASALVVIGSVVFNFVIPTSNYLIWFAPVYLVNLVAAYPIDHYAMTS